ncbi:hypothetical protein ACL02P_15335 [Paenibacillus sp. MB22_1]|uniref:hypothetical protein n=1 Tax=Paenibacillus sp. MB22_1 TaxID=3383121 RepID=UPI0039A346B7
MAHGTHPASRIIENPDRRFVSDQDKVYWNEKADGTLATQTVKGMMSPEDKTKLDSATSDKLAGTLMRRDASGRVKVVAPVAADDVARKQEVDTVQGNLNAHEGNTNIHITPAEHAKLAGIEAGAQVNQNAFGQINGIAATSESDSFTLVAGTGISIGADPIEKTLTINNQGESLPGPHAMSHVDGTDQIPNAVTGGRSGLMSGADAQFVRVDGETRTGAQAKADAARDEAKEYADLLVEGITPASIGAETPAGAQAKVDALAGEGNTKTVKQLDDEVTAHLADFAAHEADYVRQPAFAVTSGTSTAYTVALDPAPVNLPEGFGITIVPHIDCGDEPTLEINGLGAVTLKDQKGSPYGAGKLVAGKPYTFRLVGTDFLADSGSGGGEQVKGQTEEIIAFGEEIAELDPVVVKTSFYKLPNPSVLPTATGTAVSFTSDALYLAIGFAGSSGQNLYIYKRSGDNYEKLKTPGINITDLVYAVLFSPDDNYLYVGCASTPFIVIYKRAGDSFTKLANPVVLPTGGVNNLSCDQSNTYVCVGHVNSPYITIYKRDGDSFTKLSNPSTLPASNATDVTFSDDGIYLAVAHDTTPYVTIYKRSGDVFSKLANPASLPISSAAGVAFNADASYLVVVSNLGSMPITIYKRDGDTYNKIDPPDYIPVGSLEKVKFTLDQKYVVVTTSVNPFVVIYRRVGDTLIKVTNPALLPTGGANRIGTVNGYLGITHSTSPFFTVYKTPIEAVNSNPAIWGDALKIGYAEESGQAGESKKVIITHH